MNVFTDYTPQLSWQGHDKHVKSALGGTKAAAMQSAKITLPGSLKGGVLMMDIPSRNSINTSTIKQRDRTDMIKRGGR
jgi:hypothetical protein